MVHDLEVTSAHGYLVWQGALSFIYARDIFLRNTFVIGRMLQPGNLLAPPNQSKGCFADKRAKSQHRLTEYLEQTLNCILVTFVLM